MIFLFADGQYWQFRNFGDHYENPRFAIDVNVMIAGPITKMGLSPQDLNPLNQ